MSAAGQFDECDSQIDGFGIKPISTLRWNFSQTKSLQNKYDSLTLVKTMDIKIEMLLATVRLFASSIE
jgi:hypothetical protein